MKKTYNSPKVVVTFLNQSDVITLSGAVDNTTGNALKNKYSLQGFNS